MEVLYGALWGTHKTGGFIFNVVTAVRDKNLCFFIGSIAALGAARYQLLLSTVCSCSFTKNREIRNVGLLG